MPVMNIQWEYCGCFSKNGIKIPDIQIEDREQQKCRNMDDWHHRMAMVLNRISIFEIKPHTIRKPSQFCILDVETNRDTIYQYIQHNTPLFSKNSLKLQTTRKWFVKKLRRGVDIIFPVCCMRSLLENN